MVTGKLSGRALLVAVTVLLCPLFLPPYYTYLATELVIWGLLAISLDLLLGYTGLPSFGHAVFFGVPAYAVGIILGRGGSIAVALVAAILALSIVAALVGYFATRTGGVGYIVVTLLASYTLYIIAFVWTDLTGGENGLYVSKESSMAAWPPGLTYTVVAIVGVCVWLVARRLVRSGYGLVLLSIKSNEQRALALGYNIQKYKFQITLVSAAIAGLAGVLYALVMRTLSADLVGPELSTEIVIWVLLGGIQTLVGPVFGAALFISLKQMLNTFHAYPIFLGVVFVVMVTWAPGGIFSLHRLRKKATKEGDDTDDN